MIHVSVQKLNISIRLISIINIAISYTTNKVTYTNSLDVCEVVDYDLYNLIEVTLQTLFAESAANFQMDHSPVLHITSSYNDAVSITRNLRSHQYLFPSCGSQCNSSIMKDYLHVGKLHYQDYTNKKENQIFLIYREILSEAVAKSYIRNGFLIYEEMRIFPHI
jgi:hypothetical protein